MKLKFKSKFLRFFTSLATSKLPGEVKNGPNLSGKVFWDAPDTPLSSALWITIVRRIQTKRHTPFQFTVEIQCLSQPFIRTCLGSKDVREIFLAGDTSEQLWCTRFVRRDDILHHNYLHFEQMDKFHTIQKKKLREWEKKLLR